MRKLAEAGHEVVVVATEAMSEDRRKLGWSVPTLGPVRVIFGPDQKQVMEVVNSSGTDSIHLIAGARGTTLGKQVAHACRASRRRMGLITESPDPRGLGGLLRWVKYSWERITMGRHFDFILAMGRKGARWFKLCGYPEARVFPFAYVAERCENSSRVEIGKVFRFLFVGQLIPRKGVDLLLQALARVPHCELSMIGDGPEREKLQKLALECEIADRVFWGGKMKSAEAQSRLFTADVLVLPSREDGWGTVVNESLMAGTPVICSTACGSSELIQHPWLGTVFQANRIASLAEALAFWSSQGTVSAQQRQRIRNWAGCIEAPRVARYVEEVLAHVYNCGPRPQAPWRT